MMKWIHSITIVILSKWKCMPNLISSIKMIDNIMDQCSISVTSNICYLLSVMNFCCLPGVSSVKCYAFLHETDEDNKNHKYNHEEEMDYHPHVYVLSTMSAHSHISDINRISSKQNSELKSKQCLHYNHYPPLSVRTRCKVEPFWIE
jgi:hypothetical protein